MEKLKKVSVLIMGLLFFANLSGCENFMGNDDDDESAEDEDPAEASVYEQTYQTLTEAMNKAIIGVYLTMDEPTNIPGDNYFVLPESITVASDYDGFVNVSGSYEISIYQSTLYNFDLGLNIDSFTFDGVVDGSAVLTANMETTITHLVYSINYSGTGTHTGESFSNISWDITYAQDSANQGSVSGRIEIDGISYEVTDAAAVGVF